MYFVYNHIMWAAVNNKLITLKEGIIWLSRYSFLLEDHYREFSPEDIKVIRDLLSEVEW